MAQGLLTMVRLAAIALGAGMRRGAHYFMLTAFWRAVPDWWNKSGQFLLGYVPALRG